MEQFQDDDWRHSDESSDESRNRSILETAPGSSRQSASTEEEGSADGNRHWKERKQEMIRLYRMRYALTFIELTWHIDDI